MDTRQQAYLKAMGIDIWTRREVAGLAETLVAPDSAVQAASDVAVTPTADDDLSALDWQVLQIRVSTCTRCELHMGRSQTVFGQGNQQADLLIVGEAPGLEEDRQGEPFVGQSGQLLTAMLRAISFSRQDVYIVNILKCRPADDRDPKAQEIALCSPYLERQIALIQPGLILAVGRVAAQALLKIEGKLGDMRGQLHQYTPTQTPLIVTYHPAYLLRMPSAKARAWEDLLFVQRTLGDRCKPD